MPIGEAIRASLARPLVVAGPYALAVALTVGSALAASAVGSGEAQPLVLAFVVPILAAAYAGGLGPGLFATAAAFLAATSSRLTGARPFDVGDAGDRARVAMLAVVGIAISVAMHAARWRRKDGGAAARALSRNFLARQLQVAAERVKATRFQRFAQDAPIGIVLASRDGRVQLANDEALRIVGRSRGELESGAAAEGGAGLVGWLASGREGRFETDLARPDGSRVPVLVGISRQPDGFAAFLVDLTAEKEAQQARRESEERFRTLADHIAQLAWIADAAGRIVWHNRRWSEYLGPVPDEMAGVAWRRAVHPAHRARVAGSIRRCLATGQIWEETFPLRDGDGRYRWFLSQALPIVDEHGSVLRWFGTSTDVTELREAQEVLKEADRHKSEFLGVLSHELRNPLAPIRNAVYVLDHCDPRSEQARGAKAVIARQVDHLARLVDDLLDVTRIARGKIELRRASTSLSEVVSRAGEDHRPLFRERGMAFTVRMPDEEVWVDGDATRLSQVVGNLLHNAAKFSSQGGAVELALDRGEGWAEIRVKDRGAGIAPELLEKIFEPFVQAERTLARSQGGIGLGLALVKGLVELHGGSVRAASDGLGRGAEFVVRLPTSPAGTRARAPAPGAAPGRARAVRVLVVEDNRDVADTLAQVVELLGHDVEVAHDGPAALAKARARTPDFVLCDIGLPGMSGLEVARAFRADPVLRAARLVAVSGYAQPEDRKEAADAGFEFHVAKPADPADIERLLAT